MAIADDGVKAQRSDERARQAVRQSTERARKKQQPTGKPSPRLSKRGPAVRLKLDDGDGDDDGEDDAGSGSGTTTEAEAEGDASAPSKEVPFAELVSPRMARKDTTDSFEIVRPAGDRGVVALDDSVELPGPGVPEGWERVETRDAEERPSYSDVAGPGVKKDKV